WPDLPCPHGAPGGRDRRAGRGGRHHGVAGARRTGGRLMLLLPLAIAWFGALALAPLDGRRRGVGLAAVVALSASFGALIWLATRVLTSGPVEMVAGGWAPGIGIRLRADALGIAFALISIGVLLAA